MKRVAVLAVIVAAVVLGHAATVRAQPTRGAPVPDELWNPLPRDPAPPQRAEAGRPALAVGGAVLLALGLLSVAAAVAPPRSVARSAPATYRFPPGPRWWEPPAGPAPARVAGPATTAPARRARRAAVIEVTAAACVAAPALVLAGAPSWARLPAVLIVLVLAPGVALEQALTGGDHSMRTGLVAGAGLAVTGVSAQVMLWFGAWRPELALCLLAAACLACIAIPPAES
jgi:hypothetical protein